MSDGNHELLKLAADKLSLDIYCKRDPTPGIEALRVLIQAEDERKHEREYALWREQQAKRARTTETLQVVSVVFVVGCTVLGSATGYGLAWFGGSLACVAIVSAIGAAT